MSATPSREHSRAVKRIFFWFSGGPESGTFLVAECSCVCKEYGGDGDGDDEDDNNYYGDAEMTVTTTMTTLRHCPRVAHAAGWGVGLGRCLPRSEAGDTEGFEQDIIDACQRVTASLV
eukprot:gene17464-biopygen13675